MLHNALIIKRDGQASLTLAWFGGVFIQAFSDDALLVSQWEVPPTISYENVERNMEWHISYGNYPLVPFEIGEMDAA